MLLQIWNLIKEMLVIFFGKGDGKVAKKTVMAAALFRLIQWGLLGITVAIITTVRIVRPEWGFWHYLLPLWGGNIIVVCIILAIRNGKPDIDFTSMEAVRSIVDKAFALHLAAGITLETIAFLTLLVYSGAEQFYVFFEQRLSSTCSKLVVILFASFCSMFVWVLVFYTGASGLVELVKMLYR